MLFKIPKIEWEATVTEHGITRHRSLNTFVYYTIQEFNDFIFVYYKDGSYKEFKSIDEAKEWVEAIHYPAQVRKFFVVLG